MTIRVQVSVCWLKFLSFIANLPCISSVRWEIIGVSIPNSHIHRIFTTLILRFSAYSVTEITCQFITCLDVELELALGAILKCLNLLQDVWDPNTKKLWLIRGKELNQVEFLTPTPSPHPISRSLLISSYYIKELFFLWHSNFV